MAIMDLVQQIEANRDGKLHTVALFLDLKKAFDTVCHQVLLGKLENYGCRGIALRLFSSYLENRQQFTVANGGVSSVNEIAYGVPQGSILGPLLFLIYINDIDKGLPAALKLFADDTVILVSHKEPAVLQKQANEVLQKTHDWLITNRLTLNATKTVYVFFGANKRHHQIKPPVIKIENTEIVPTQVAKYLGFQIDDKLSCKFHICALIKKLSQLTGVFHKVSCMLTIQAKNLLYYSMVHPYLAYCIEIYGSVSNTLLGKLQRTQNKLIKALYQLGTRTNTTEMYSRLNIDMIGNLYKIRASISMNKIMMELKNGDSTLNVHHELIRCNPLLSHNYPTRGVNSFNLHFNKAAYTNGIIFNILLVWNSLPPHIKNEQNLKAAKEKIERFFSN
jgi:hypothetical protein